MSVVTKSVSLPPYVSAICRLVLVPAGLLWAFMHAPEVGLTGKISLNFGWLLVALILNQVALFLFSARLRLVLGLWSVHIGRLSSLRIHLQSMFYFIVVPMTIGLEIARFLKISSIAPSASKIALAAALFADRILGALSALALALLCVLLLNVNAALVVPPHVLWAGLAVALAFIAIVASWPRSRREIAAIWSLTSGRRGKLLGILALSMFMNIVFALGIQTASVAVGTPIALLDTVFAISGGMLLVAVPLSLAGIGPAEAGTVALLIILGHDVLSAMTVGALPYFARLVAAVEGGLWEFVDGGRTAFVTLLRPGSSKIAVPPTEK